MVKGSSPTAHPHKANCMTSYLLEGAEKQCEEHFEQREVREQQLHTLAAGVAAGQLEAEDGEHRSLRGRSLQGTNIRRPEEQQKIKNIVKRFYLTNEVWSTKTWHAYRTYM